MDCLRGFAAVAICLMMLNARVIHSQEVDTHGKTSALRIQASQSFHSRSTQSAGLLIPLYVYPENIHTNQDYNRIIQLKRDYPTIPFWVIVNPASGPGTSADGNYLKAIDRLIGAGCVVIGYVPTNYGKTSIANVTKDLLAWKKMYPRTHGIFFDEMIYEDNDQSALHQSKLNTVAHEMGFWPIVANPGTDTPGRYFSREVADVIVIHESNEWPSEKKLQGDYFGGYSDYPSFTRGILMYSQKEFDPKAVKMSLKYTRWIYVTDDIYKLNDPKNPNPWDQLSVHLEKLCETIAPQ